MPKIKQLIANGQGATAIEYALIAALISIAVIGAMTMVADETIKMWDYVSKTLIDAV